MPVTVFEIMLAKCFIDEPCGAFSSLGLKVVVQGALQVPIEGSLLYFSLEPC